MLRVSSGMWRDLIRCLDCTRDGLSSKVEMCSWNMASSSCFWFAQCRIASATRLNTDIYIYIIYIYISWEHTNHDDNQELHKNAQCPFSTSRKSCRLEALTSTRRTRGRLDDTPALLGGEKGAPPKSVVLRLVGNHLPLMLRFPFSTSRMSRRLGKRENSTD